jgi:hypothetical protein
MAKEVDLNFIASQSERLLAEVAAMRHDVAVLMAIAMRLEAAQAATLQELHATRAQARNGDAD